jgi:hypothetical protein
MNDFLISIPKSKILDTRIVINSISIIADVARDGTKFRMSLGHNLIPNAPLDNQFNNFGLLLFCFILFGDDENNSLVAPQKVNDYDFQNI